MLQHPKFWIGGLIQLHTAIALILLLDHLTRGFTHAGIKIPTIIKMKQTYSFFSLAVQFK